MSDQTPHNSAEKVERTLSRRFQVDLVFEGILVGIFGGGVVTLYRLSLSTAEKALRFATGFALGKPVLMVIWFVVLALLMLLVGALVRWEPATTGSGIPQVDAEVVDRLDMPWHRVIVAKFIEGTACALAGLSLGREGPSVQLGGMAGKGVSRFLKRDRDEERLLVTCGAAAGMSAAFHAPLTGVLFALEEIHKEFTSSLIISVMVSSLVADYLVSGVLGVQPVLSLRIETPLPHGYYALLALLGIACGLLGALHNRGMFVCQALYERIQRGVPYLRYAIPFALAGIVAFACPELMCGGDAIIERVITSNGVTFVPVILLLIGKYLYTTVSFGSGAPGGTLFPLVVMGVLIGSAFALAANGTLGLSIEYYAEFLALGIAGLFASVVRAPVTGCILVFELTASLDAMLAVSLVSITSYLVANLTRTDPFYEHLLARQLKIKERGARPKDMAGRKVFRTFRVGSSSWVEGKAIREIPWPDNTRVVIVERAAKELIPTGDMKLEALDEVTLIMDVNAADDVELKIQNMTKPSLL